MNSMRFICCLLILILSLSMIAIGAPATSGVEVNAKAAVLIEASTGQVLYELNPNEHLSIASVTKVMTMLLIMEALDGGRIHLDDMVVCSDYAASMGGSQIYLEPGEQMSVHDMIKSIAVASANDACVAMAEHIMGSETAFIEEMNKRAMELGMKNTNFVNTNGLDEPNHYSSAYDVALVSKELLKHPKITEYLTIWMDSVRNGEFGLANTNRLVRFYNGANGIKTGSTSEALYCLSAGAKRDGMQLIAVVLGAPTTNDRFNSASKLLDYGFANYAIMNEANDGKPLSMVKVHKGTEEELGVVPNGQLQVLLPKGKQSMVKKNMILPQTILAPVKQGQKVGQIEYILDNKSLGTVDLIAQKNVNRINPFMLFWKLLDQWVSLE